MFLKKENVKYYSTFLRTKKYCLVAQKWPLSCQLATSDLDQAYTTCLQMTQGRGGRSGGKQVTVTEWATDFA